MKEKYYDSTSSLILGSVFAILGIILFIGKEQMYHQLVYIVVFVMFARALANMIRFFYRRQTNRRSSQTFLSCLFHFVVSLLFCFVPSLSFGIAPFLFAFYLIVIGVSQFVMCFVEVRNGEFIPFSQVLMGMIYIGISVPIFCFPVTKVDTFLNCVAIYVLLLGITFLYDFTVQILSIRTRNHLKRKVRVTLPKIIEAIIPYSVMCEINRNLELEHGYQYSYSFDQEEGMSDLNILIHTSNRGFNRMGHIDICFEGQVISYGNYDEGSRSWHDLFGDGVMFITNQKKEYINFCIEHSKKTVFDFGIRLNEEQKIRVRKRIEELCKNTVPWNHSEDRKYHHGSSYAAKLEKRTHAKFYKFKKGKYKTYFVLGTNCCFLVDDIVGKSGMDILSINGIITPGTYYDYLNRALKLKRSNVISKEIYNFDRKA